MPTTVIDTSTDAAATRYPFAHICVALPDSIVVFYQEGAAGIMFDHSEDAGATWAGPTVLSARTDMYPSVVANIETQDIHVIYSKQVDDPTLGAGESIYYRTMTYLGSAAWEIGDEVEIGFGHAGEGFARAVLSAASDGKLQVLALAKTATARFWTQWTAVAEWTLQGAARTTNPFPGDASAGEKAAMAQTSGVTFALRKAGTDYVLYREPAVGWGDSAVSYTAIDSWVASDSDGFEVAADFFGGRQTVGIVYLDLNGDDVYFRKYDQDGSVLTAAASIYSATNAAVTSASLAFCGDYYRAVVIDETAVAATRLITWGSESDGFTAWTTLATDAGTNEWDHVSLAQNNLSADSLVVVWCEVANTPFDVITDTVVFTVAGEEIFAIRTDAGAGADVPALELPVADAGTGTESSVGIELPVADAGGAVHRNYVYDPSFEHTTLTDHWNTSAIDSRSGAQAEFGSWSLRKNGAGLAAAWYSTRMKLAEAMPVYPGMVVTGSVWAYLISETDLTAIQVNVLWYTSSDVYISTSYGEYITDPNADFERITCTDVAPATAAKAIISIDANIGGAGAAAIDAYFDGAQMERGCPARDYFDGSMANVWWEGTANRSVSYQGDDWISEPQRRNLVHDPSFEYATIATHWDINATTDSRSGAQARYGSFSLLKNASGLAPGWYSTRTKLADCPAVQEGEQWTASVEALAETMTDVYSLRLLLLWYTAADVYIGTTYDNGYPTAVSDDWVRWSVTGTAPAGAGKVRVAIDAHVGGDGSSGAVTAYFDGVLLEKTDVANPFFDGSFTYGCWEEGGGDNSSPSRLRPPEPRMAMADTDTGSGAEEPIGKSMSGGQLDDTGAGTEVTAIILGLVSDAGSGAETVVIVLPVSDSGSGADSVTGPTISLVDPETGVGTEVAAITVTVADTGSGAEVSGIALAVVDAGAGAEASIINLSVSDAGAGAELIEMAFQLSDSGVGADVINRIGIAVADAGSGAEVSTIILNLTETGTGADVPTRTVVMGLLMVRLLMSGGRLRLRMKGPGS